MKTRNVVFTMLFFGVFLIAGIFILLWGIRSSQDALRSAQWPSVNGWITSSTVTSSRDSKGHTTYSASVHYKYQVSGQVYTGSKVSFGDVSTSNSSDAAKVVTRYQNGMTIKVIYNPNDPSQAVLEPGFSAGLLIPLGIGTIFTLVGGLMLIKITISALSGNSETSASELPSS